VTREAGHRSNTVRARLARTLCTLLNKEEEQAPNIRPAGRHRPSQREVTRADIRNRDALSTRRAHDASRCFCSRHHRAHPTPGLAMDDASTFLKNHPIFVHSDDANGVLSVDALSQRSLGVSTSASYTSRLAGDAEGPFFGRRNTMVIRNHDLVVAVDSEIRMTSLVTDAEVPKSYTVGAVGFAHRASRSPFTVADIEDARSQLQDRTSGIEPLWETSGCCRQKATRGRGAALQCVSPVQCHAQ
jgi:hypothetical protein